MDDLNVTRLIVVTVGRSVIDQTFPPPSDKQARAESFFLGHTSAESIQQLEQGDGGREQLELEQSFFDQACSFGDVEASLEGLRRGRTNPHSAEVSSLHQMMVGYPSLGITPQNMKIVLLATDSPDGIFAARLNKRLICHLLLHSPKSVARDWRKEEDNGSIEQLLRVLIRRVPGLQVKNVQEFVEEGVKHLRAEFQQLQEETPGAQRFLNITGGFKGVIPLTTALAWAFGWRLFYLYESSPELIRIPCPGDVKFKVDDVKVERGPGIYGDL